MCARVRVCTCVCAYVRVQDRWPDTSCCGSVFVSGRSRDLDWIPTSISVEGEILAKTPPSHLCLQLMLFLVSI